MGDGVRVEIECKALGAPSIGRGLRPVCARGSFEGECKWRFDGGLRGGNYSGAEGHFGSAVRTAEARGFLAPRAAELHGAA